MSGWDEVKWEPVDLTLPRTNNQINVTNDLYHGNIESKGLGENFSNNTYSTEYLNNIDMYPISNINDNCTSTPPYYQNYSQTSCQNNLTDLDQNLYYTNPNFYNYQNHSTIYENSSPHLQSSQDLAQNLQESLHTQDLSDENSKNLNQVSNMCNRLENIKITEIYENITNQDSVSAMQYMENAQNTHEDIPLKFENKQLNKDLLSENIIDGTSISLHSSEPLLNSLKEVNDKGDKEPTNFNTEEVHENQLAVEYKDSDVISSAVNLPGDFSALPVITDHEEIEFKASPALDKDEDGGQGYISDSSFAHCPSNPTKLEDLMQNNQIAPPVSLPSSQSNALVTREIADTRRNDSKIKSAEANFDDKELPYLERPETPGGMSVDTNTGGRRKSRYQRYFPDSRDNSIAPSIRYRSRQGSFISNYNTDLEYDPNYITATTSHYRRHPRIGGDYNGSNNNNNNNNSSVTLSQQRRRQQAKGGWQRISSMTTHSGGPSEADDSYEADDLDARAQGNLQGITKSSGSQLEQTNKYREKNSSAHEPSSRPEYADKRSRRYQEDPRRTVDEYSRKKLEVKLLPYGRGNDDSLLRDRRHPRLQPPYPNEQSYRDDKNRSRVLSRREAADDREYYNTDNEPTSEYFPARVTRGRSPPHERSRPYDDSRYGYNTRNAPADLDHSRTNYHANDNFPRVKKYTQYPTSTADDFYKYGSRKQHPSSRDYYERRDSLSSSSQQQQQHQQTNMAARNNYSKAHNYPTKYKSRNGEADDFMEEERSNPSTYVRNVEEIGEQESFRTQDYNNASMPQHLRHSKNEHPSPKRNAAMKKVNSRTKQQPPPTSLLPGNNPFFPPFYQQQLNPSNMTENAAPNSTAGGMEDPTTYWQQTMQNYYVNYYKMIAATYPQAQYYFPPGFNPLEHLNETLEEESSESEELDSTAESEKSDEETCKEPFFYTRPHSIVRFCPNGTVLICGQSQFLLTDKPRFAGTGTEIETDPETGMTTNNEENLMLRETDDIFLKQSTPSGEITASDNTIRLYNIEGLFKDIKEYKEFPGPLIRFETHKDDLLNFCARLSESWVISTATSTRIEEDAMTKSFDSSPPSHHPLNDSHSNLGSPANSSRTSSIQNIATTVSTGKAANQPTENSRVSENKQTSSKLLLLDYLCLLIRQNGAVIGADISKLLVPAASNKNIAPAANSTATLTNTSRLNPVDQQQQLSSVGTTNQTFNVTRFRHLLLCGHQKEALEYATKSGAWGHAFFMALQSVPPPSSSSKTTSTSLEDKSILNQLINRFLSTIQMTDPILTFHQTLAGRESTYLNQIKLLSNTTVALNNASSGAKLSAGGGPMTSSSSITGPLLNWRSHLAMLVANPSSNPRKNGRNIEILGDVLRQSADVPAAHLCYLLSHVVPFGNFDDPNSKLVLLTKINNLPLSKFMGCEAYRLTEIYEYTRQLVALGGGSRPETQFDDNRPDSHIHHPTMSPPTSAGSPSFIAPFQPFKYLYAVWLLERGLVPDSFRYLEIIARTVLKNPHPHPRLFILHLYELASRLRYANDSLNAALYNPSPVHTITPSSSPNAPNPFLEPVDGPDWFRDLARLYGSFMPPAGNHDQFVASQSSRSVMSRPRADTLEAASSAVNENHGTETLAPTTGAQLIMQQTEGYDQNYHPKMPPQIRLFSTMAPLPASANDNKAQPGNFQSPPAVFPSIPSSSLTTNDVSKNQQGTTFVKTSGEPISINSASGNNFATRLNQHREHLSSTSSGKTGGVSSSSIIPDFSRHGSFTQYQSSFLTVTGGGPTPSTTNQPSNIFTPTPHDQLQQQPLINATLNPIQQQNPPLISFFTPRSSVILSPNAAPFAEDQVVRNEAGNKAPPVSSFLLGKPPNSAFIAQPNPNFQQPHNAALRPNFPQPQHPSSYQMNPGVPSNFALAAPGGAQMYAYQQQQPVPHDSYQDTDEDEDEDEEEGPPEYYYNSSRQRSATSGTEKGVQNTSSLKADNSSSKMTSNKPDKGSSTSGGSVATKGGGWFGGIMNKILPKGPNQMILPDDTKKSIVWNDTKKRWENADGTCAEEETAPPPPPDFAMYGGGAFSPQQASPPFPAPFPQTYNNVATFNPNQPQFVPLQQPQHHQTMNNTFSGLPFQAQQGLLGSSNSNTFGPPSGGSMVNNVPNFTSLYNGAVQGAGFNNAPTVGLRNRSPYVDVFKTQNFPSVSPGGGGLNNSVVSP